MEPVTHFLTGACLGRTGFNRKTAYATLAMTLAAEAPDIDVLWSFRGPVAGFLASPRHYSHLFGCTLGRPRGYRSGLALASQPAWPPPLPPRWALLWLLSLLAVFSHIFLDWTNNYGVRPFFPLTRAGTPWISPSSSSRSSLLRCCSAWSYRDPRTGRSRDRRTWAVVPRPRLGYRSAGPGRDRLGRARG